MAAAACSSASGRQPIITRPITTIRYYPPYYYYPPPVYAPVPAYGTVQPLPPPMSPAAQDGSGQTCREYQTTVQVNGQWQPAYGTACLQPDGTWRTVQ